MFKMCLKIMFQRMRKIEIEESREIQGKTDWPYVKNY